VDYQVAFDAAREGYHGWWFGLFGLIFAGIGLTMVGETRAARGAMKVFAWVFVGFSILWTGVATCLPYREHQKAVERLAKGQTEVVEGPVENFRPQPRGGHARERFTVKGVAFSFSDNVLTPGFHRTVARGGPLREGLPVRINYDPRHQILRLEIPKEVPYVPNAGFDPAALPFLLFTAIFLGLPAMGAVWRWQGGTLGLPYEERDALFLESMCSGRSLRNWFTRIAGANNALIVGLTRDKLYFDLIMPFRLVANFGLIDFQKAIALSALTRVEKIEMSGVRKWAMSGVGALEVEWRLPTGGNEAFALYLSRRDELFEKIRQLRPEVCR
jgi:hypothetical protein